MHKVRIIYLIRHHADKVSVFGNSTCAIVEELDSGRPGKGMSQVIHAIRENNGTDFPRSLRGRRQMPEPNFHFLDIRGEQRHRGQCRRANRKALARCRRRIPKHVEFIRASTYFRIEARHLGVSARIICNRPKRIRRQRNAKRTQHAHSGKAHAIKAHRHVVKSTGTSKCRHNAHHDRHHREARREHAHRNTVDNRRRSPEPRLPRNSARRLVSIRRIVFRKLPDENACRKARKHGTENSHRNKVQLDQHKERHENQNRRPKRPRQERTQQRFRRSIFARAYRKDSHNRKDNPDCRDNHRRNDHLDATHRESRPESRRRKNGTAIGFVKVRAHASHIAHVVAHVICNRRRIARVVFGNAGLDFAHEVRTDIGRLRIDATANAGKQRLQ